MSQKIFTRLASCKIESMWLILNTKISVYHSKAKSYAKILFGKIAHLKDPKISNLPVSSFYRNQRFHIPGP